MQRQTPGGRLSGVSVVTDLQQPGTPVEVQLTWMVPRDRRTPQHTAAGTG